MQQKDKRKQENIRERGSATATNRTGLSLRIIVNTNSGVCLIKLSNGKRGTGFFGCMDSGAKMHFALFTCNHLINADYLKSENCKILLSNGKKEYELLVQSTWFTNKDLDATVIEMTDEQVDRIVNLNFWFLHLNYSVQPGDGIFLLEHPQCGDIRFAPGAVEQVTQAGNLFYHNCDTDNGSSGSPVTNKNGQVLGIHCGVDSDGRKYAVKIKAVRDAAIQQLAVTDTQNRDVSMQLREMEQLVLKQEDQIKRLENLQLRSREPTRDEPRAAQANKIASNIQPVSVQNGTQSDLLVSAPAASATGTHFDLLFCFGGFSGSHESSRQIQMYNPTSDKWYNVAKLKNKYCCAAAAVWNDTVIVTGGWDEWKSVGQYDFVSNTCKPFPNLHLGRHYHALVNLNGTLYAIGGWNAEHKVSNNVEKFHKFSKNWVAASPLNTARSHLAAGTLQDCILVAGGYDGSTSLSSCELYGSTLQQWSLIASLNRQRLAAAAATYKNTVYVFGGSCDSEKHNDAEQYNRRTDKWTLLNMTMLYARDCIAAATVGNAVYLLGGLESNGYFTDSVESFEFATKTWLMNTALPSARGDLAAIGVRVSSATLARLKIACKYTAIRENCDVM